MIQVSGKVGFRLCGSQPEVSAHPYSADRPTQVPYPRRSATNWLKGEKAG